MKNPTGNCPEGERKGKGTVKKMSLRPNYSTFLSPHALARGSTSGSGRNPAPVRRQSSCAGPDNTDNPSIVS